MPTLPKAAVIGAGSSGIAAAKALHERGVAHSVETWREGRLVGGLYGLAAAGLSLTFGVLRVLNVAHGELLMLGSYTTFWLFTLWGVNPLVSLLVAAAGLFLVGVVLQLGLVERVVGIDRSRRRILGRMPGQDEARPLALGDGEVGDGREVLAADSDV